MQNGELPTKNGCNCAVAAVGGGLPDNGGNQFN